MQGNFFCELMKAFCLDSKWTLKMSISLLQELAILLSCQKCLSYPPKMINLIKPETSSLMQSKSLEINESNTVEKKETESVTDKF